MGGDTTLGNIQGHKHRNPARPAIILRNCGWSHERRTYTGRCLMRRGQPHLSEPKTLQVRNRLFEKVPPAQLRVFAIPSKELDLSEERALESITILFNTETHHHGVLGVPRRSQIHCIQGRWRRRGVRVVEHRP